ncbi:MAG TPA: hypothetical protein VL069_15575 [Opitutus sp.]|nr:hypothetical protein [Opitutus sp.]
MSLSRTTKYFLAVFTVALQLLGIEVCASTIKTNGNGDPTDVGIWYCANWDANGGGWWSLATYRPLLPDGSYGMHDGSDVAVIDFHLEKLAEAQIDFILFDDTNGDFNGYGPGNGWIKEKSKAVCARIKLWNESHSWKIKYAFAIGSFMIGDSKYPTATSYEVIEQQARCVAQEVYLNHDYNSNDYYQIDGKPLLVVLDYNRDARARWASYHGAKEWASRFALRWAGTSGGYSVAAGDYGWAMNAAGVLLHPEVEYLQPGHDNHLPAGAGWMHTSRKNGDYYANNWDKILSNPRPRIVMIGAFNDYTEDSAVWTADTSVDYPKSRLPIERWRGHDGQLHPSMYWDYTVGIIRTLRHGVPKPIMAGSTPALGAADREQR